MKTKYLFLGLLVMAGFYLRFKTRTEEQMAYEEARYEIGKACYSASNKREGSDAR